MLFYYFYENNHEHDCSSIKFVYHNTLCKISNMFIFSKEILSLILYFWFKNIICYMCIFFIYPFEFYFLKLYDSILCI